MSLRELVKEELALSKDYSFKWLSEYVDNADISDRIGVIHVLANSREMTPAFRMQVAKVSARLTCVARWFQIPIEPNAHTILSKIYLIPCPEKRIAPEAMDAPISENDINGGFTYIRRSGRAPIIIVFRMEEFPKVLLHEMLHHSFLQSRMDPWPIDQVAELKRAFGIAADMDLLPQEGVIEAWAEVLQCFFVSEELGVPMGTLLAEEKANANRMAHELLDRQKKLTGGLWHETTNAYAYIVFRSIFLNSIEEFMTLETPVQYTALLLKNAGIVNAHTSQRESIRAGDNALALRMTRFGDF